MTVTVTVTVTATNGATVKRLNGVDALMLYSETPEIPGRLHHPMWIENQTVALDYHLRHLEIAAAGVRRELDELIGRTASTALDQSGPLWGMYVVEGLVGDRVATVHEVHHVLADGVASANQMSQAISPRGPQVDDVEPAPHPGHTPRRLLRAAGEDHLRQIRRLPALVRDTAAGVSRVDRMRSFAGIRIAAGITTPLTDVPAALPPAAAARS